MHAPKLNASYHDIEEQKRRKKAVEKARASLRLEGVKVSAEAEKHASRFIKGGIDLAEFVKGYNGPRKR